MIYLQKANDDLVSHCTCEIALVASPGQADCPWCGCGWLWSCMKCRKAFSFAVGVEVPQSPVDLAVRDLAAFLGDASKIEDEDLDDWTTGMPAWMEDVQIGERYVYFDGAIIHVDSGELKFDGVHSAHNLEFVPQVRALADPTVMDEILRNYDYWEGNRRSAEE